MILLHPWLVLVVLPFLWSVLQQRKKHLLSTTLLRCCISLLLGVALTQPSCQMGQSGLAIVVVVDRSLSMPQETDRRSIEVIRLIEKDLKEHDRLAIVSVTETIIIEKEFSSRGAFQGFQSVQSPHGSRLDRGLEQALSLIPPLQSGRILLISDGENTGQDLERTRELARSRNIPVHIKQLTRQRENDLSISDIHYPQQVSQGEPVQISADILSPTPQTVTISLKRDSQVIASGSKTLRVGHNSIQLMDQLQQGGIHQYQLIVDSKTDTHQGNNIATFGTLADGRRTVLIINQDGTRSSLHHALQENNISVETVDVRLIELSTAMLTRYQAVILQDVPAISFRSDELRNLAYYVENLGGGLLMTGGPLSFGMGGYIESPLEDLLPVNLEIRQEHRKVGLALGIALDRSGSMSVGVGPNLTKMDLANQGASVALSLLSPIDSATVFAVDTEPHLVIPLQEANNPSALQQAVLGIEPNGGGIYVGEALDALYPVLQNAKQNNRHIALFADANDAVDQEGVLAQATKMREDNITISVIALGQPSDADADFLAQLALNGGGDIYFTMNPNELPKLFAMDTLLATKASFKEEVTEISNALGLTGLGGKQYPNFPRIEGYNITYFKDKAQNGLQTKNTDPIDPILSYRQYGLGITAAFTGQIDGSYGQNLREWSNYASFWTELIRSISSAQATSFPYAGSQREGQQQIYTIESANTIPKAMLFRPDGEEQVLSVEQTDDETYQAILEHNIPGIHVVHVETENGAVLLPPLSLPYSSEFKPRASEHDRKELRRLRSLTGGELNPSVSKILSGPQETRHLQALLPYLLLLSLGLLVLEISNRRIGIFQYLSSRLPSVPKDNGNATISPSRSKTMPKEIEATPLETEDSPAHSKRTDDMRAALERLRKK